MRLTILAGAMLWARGDSRLAYHFEGAEPPGFFEPPRARRAPARSSTLYHNPITLAREWQSRLRAGECSSRADLARKLGVSRARVTQVLGLLDLAPEVLDTIAALGDPLPRPIISERMLRPLLNLPAEEQQHALKDLVGFPARPSAFQQENRIGQSTPR